MFILNGKLSEVAISQSFGTNPSCFIIYPNPTAELLILDMKDNVGLAASISIYAKTGQLMAQREVPAVADKIEFQVGHYPSGT